MSLTRMILCDDVGDVLIWTSCEPDPCENPCEAAQTHSFIHCKVGRLTFTASEVMKKK